MSRPIPLHPRKSPRQARASATVEAILEAAARILEEDGLPALNTNAVAERAGVSVGSLYQYFPGKQALLAELLRREQAERLAGIAAVLAAAPGLQEGISALVRGAVAQQAARPRLARVLDAEERRLLGETEVAERARAIRAAIAAFLRAHAVELTLSDHEEAAGDLIAITRGMVDAAGEALVPDPAGLEARILRAVEGYLGLARSG